MNKALESWRKIVNTLELYGIREMLQEEINEVVEILKKGGIESE